MNCSKNPPHPNPLPQGEREVREVSQMEERIFSSFDESASFIFPSLDGRGEGRVIFSN